MLFNRSKKLLQEKERELAQALARLAYYETEFKEVIDKEQLLNDRMAHIKSTEQQLAGLNESYRQGLALHNTLEAEIALYQEGLEIGSFGLYKPVFSFDTSEKFRQALDANYERQKKLIKADEAVVCTTEWSVGGSKAEGLKMTNQYKKLMLFAFNGECEGLISKTKWNNAAKTKERIIKTFDAVNKLGVSQHAHITRQFLDLKLEELALTYEHEQKKYEEKEEQRMIREQMREEERAQRELEKAQRDAEDEERRFQKALDKARFEMQDAPAASASALAERITELEAKLQEAHDRKERAIAQAQLTKVGHIYVISNIGSFGEGVYKIGMTRRLDPMDRVKELGDASVPFHFDVHAIIYSENAPQLEYDLHKKFSERRLNRINQKKEFFRVSLEEIEACVKEHANSEIIFTRLAEAREYRETMVMIEQVNQVIEKMEEISGFPKSLIRSH